MCSTPFGITEVGIRRHRSSVKPKRVLNAFRHHRGGHDRWGDDIEPPREVLNAFRHHRGGHPGPAAAVLADTYGAQRLSASQRWACPGKDPTGSTLHLCSTPFGITEVGILGHVVQARGVGRVLNAFRHHRGGHVDLSEGVGRDDTACSTPFGITEVGIASRFAHRRPMKCAQRLSASQRWAWHAGAVDRDHVSVLNAFRHHRGGHFER